jgi:hypothetical protein
MNRRGNDVYEILLRYLTYSTITSVKKAWQHYLPHQRDMSQQDAQLSNQEGRILLALSAYNNCQCKSLRLAAEAFKGASFNNTNTLVDTVYPPLPSLVDALIDSLLDCPSDNHVLQTHLAAEIASLYSWSPMLKEKAFAQQLVYEHRQYHLDVLFGMDHGTVQFISHQRNVREATRQRTHDLQECSAPDNKDLFTRELQAEILASMPKPTIDLEVDGKDEDGWEIYDESGQIALPQGPVCTCLREANHRTRRRRGTSAKRL